MLNAFRHHRNSHYDHRDRFGSTEECSTPFGIIGILTGDLTGTYPNPSVCSTPFGIIGILTNHRTAIVNRSRGAQRLSASSEFSRVRLEWLSRSLRVLNAFRHHRNSHCAGSNHIVCRTLQVCFHASLCFALNIPLLYRECPWFRLTIAKESDT